jgi:hypothetical protein
VITSPIRISLRERLSSNKAAKFSAGPDAGIEVFIIQIQCLRKPAGCDGVG